MKYLFVCSFGKQRSPTAAEIATQMAKERGMPLVADYVGLKQPTHSGDITVLKDRLNAFDRYFVMDHWMKVQLSEKYEIPEEKIVFLDIPDMFQKNDPVLMAVLREKLDRWIVA
ncbi:MAG: hypothetical protein C0404_01705 [Verrucomicrobia bacterium]|nr:hypothetical protein [Verrucomicrobiota bacterium]